MRHVSDGGGLCAYKQNGLNRNRLYRQTMLGIVVVVVVYSGVCCLPLRANGSQPLTTDRTLFCRLRTSAVTLNEQQECAAVNTGMLRPFEVD